MKYKQVIQKKKLKETFGPFLDEYVDSQIVKVMIMGPDMQSDKPSATLRRKLVEKCEEEGISVEIIDPRTLVPFDDETVLRSIEKTGRLVVVEEECKRGGAAAEVAAMVVEKGFHYLKAPIFRVAAKEAPIPYAPVLENYIIPQKEDIISAVKNIVD